MTYPEGASGSKIIQQQTKKCVCPIDTQQILLQQLRDIPYSKIKEDWQVVNFLREMEDYDREHFKVLHLDTQNRVIGIETIAVGTLNEAMIHPREVVKGAILNNANAVILIHNHPSGNCEKSDSDKTVEQSLDKAFDLLGIKVLDHIVISKECFSSNSCIRCAHSTEYIESRGKK